MSALKTIHLSPEDGKLINDLADYILEEMPEFAERAERFELIEGKAALMGSGEQAFIKITITYNTASAEDLEAIERILEHAKAGADEITIEVDDGSAEG